MVPFEEFWFGYNSSMGMFFVFFFLIRVIEIGLSMMLYGFKGRDALPSLIILISIL